MTTYYIRKTGSDGAAGTSPGTAWLTIGKALGATGIGSGDTVYIGAGVYREVVTVAMTSAVAETKLIGDVDGAQTGDAGEVRWTAYLTNDKTASSGSTLLAPADRDFLTFQNIFFQSGNASIVFSTSGTTAATNWSFIDCTFQIGHSGGASPQIDYNNITDGQVVNWLLDRCTFIGHRSGPMVNLTFQKGVAADYDVGFIIRNCLFIGSATGIQIGGTSGTFKAGGVVTQNCSFFFESTSGIRANNAFLSTSIPCTVTNCFFYIGGGTCITGNTTGQFTEDYNIFVGNAPSNVSAGAHSPTTNTYAPLFHFGQERKWGARQRPFGMPSPSSPLLVVGGTAPPSVDYLNTPRPDAALTAAGALERSDTFGKETGTVRTGSNAISITGPGYQDFEVPVAASSTTISVYVRWDATYAGTKPIMQRRNGTECGVSDATITATGSSGSWEQLSTTFTPTSAGIITIRLLSSDTNGGGKMFADDFAIS